MTGPASLSDVGNAIGLLLGTAGVGVWADDVSDPNVGLVLGRIGTAPSQAIGITPYPLSGEDPKNDACMFGVQLRFRGAEDLQSVLDLSAAAFNVLHGLQDVQMGRIYLAIMWRSSSAPGGYDENNRALWFDTYWARGNWPTQYRDF